MQVVCWSRLLSLEVLRASWEYRSFADTKVDAILKIIWTWIVAVSTCPQAKLSSVQYGGENSGAQFTPIQTKRGDGYNEDLTYLAVMAVSVLVLGSNQTMMV